MSGNLMRSESRKVRKLGEEAYAEQTKPTSGVPFTPSTAHEDCRNEDDGSKSNEALRKLLESDESIAKKYTPQDGTNRNSKIHRFQKRFSIFLIISAMISAIFLVGTTTFLSFLWYSAASNPLWRRIVLAGWMTRSATLSAVILRVAISIQAGIATSMMASLAIEVTGIQFFDILEFSIIRFSNSGPYKLFWLCAKKPTSIILLSLLGILSLSTLVTQFASTLLLSDVELFSIEASAIEISVLYGFKDDGILTSSNPLPYTNSYDVNYWANYYSDYHAFGEYSLPVDQTDDIDDTGTVIRAILPIADKNEREKLLKYKGPAFTLDYRVVCVQPQFLTMEVCEATEADGSRICGQVAPRLAIRDAVINMNGSAYNCATPTEPSCFRNEICDERQFTLCRLNSYASGGLISALDPINNASLNHIWHSFDAKESLNTPDDPKPGLWEATNGNLNWPVDLGNAYLIINSTWPSPRWNESSSPTYHGPWAKFETAPQPGPGSSGEPNTVYVSLCYDALSPDRLVKHFQDFNISLSASHPREEPTMRPNATFRGFDSIGVRKQLGVIAGKPTLEERGLLALSGKELFETVADLRSEWVPPDNYIAKSDWSYDNGDHRDGRWFDIPTQSWVLHSAFISLDPGSQIHFCLSCLGADGTAGSVASPAHTLLFNDALFDTGSPAHALQAFLTVIMRSAYYTWLPMSNAQDKAITISSVERLAPVSSRGYWILMAILVTHITVCVIIFYLFWSRTKHSLIGSIWASFAQVTCNEPVQSILIDGSKRTDKEISFDLSKNGDLRRRYRVESTNSGDTATLAPMAS